VILTIGHSKHPIEQFIGLLGRHGVTALADVRSTPYSHFNPQYHRKALAQSLNLSGIEYVFLGAELGARSSDPACYEGGRVSYARLASTATFQRGIGRLQAGMLSHRIAIMCAEKEPLDCHRTILVARELRQRSIEVAHILANGEIEPHDATLHRLKERLGLAAGDLFAGDETQDAEAYDLQGRRIAYAGPPPREP
jgi:uncharacterized protein (DUF488 family)